MIMIAASCEYLFIGVRNVLGLFKNRAVAIWQFNRSVNFSYNILTSVIMIRWQLVAAAGSIIEIEGTLDIFIYLISQFLLSQIQQQYLNFLTLIKISLMQKNEMLQLQIKKMKGILSHKSCNAVVVQWEDMWSSNSSSKSNVVVVVVSPSMNNAHFKQIYPWGVKAAAFFVSNVIVTWCLPHWLPHAHNIT